MKKTTPNKIHPSILAELVRKLGRGGDYLLKASNVLYTLSGRFDAVEDYKGKPNLTSASTAGVQSYCASNKCSVLFEYSENNCANCITFSREK